MKQYNPGKWVGTYYMLLQSSASYATFPNFIVGFFNLWALWELKIQSLLPWMVLPVFITSAVVFLFVVMPIFHYVFMQASVVTFQNEQFCKHENPLLTKLREQGDQLDRLEEMVKGLKK